LILLLLALFAFPIAVYCTVLGLVNRRMRPLVVSGVWDFLGVLLATSGFLLFLGPALLSGVFQEGLSELPFQPGSSGASIGNLWASWWLFWLLYYLVALGGAAWLLWLRRDTSVIYNIHPQTLDAVLAQLVERLHLQASRRGNRLFLGVSAAPVALTPPAEVSIRSAEAVAAIRDLTARTNVNPAAPPPVGLIDEQVIVDVEAFEVLSNATLHWRSASPTARSTLERGLRQVLAETFAPESGVASWLLGIATLLFLVILMLTTVFVLSAFKRMW
jgi:hypothetical protein